MPEPIFVVELEHGLVGPFPTREAAATWAYAWAATQDRLVSYLICPVVAAETVAGGAE